MQVCNDTFHTKSFNTGRLCGFYSHSCVGLNTNIKKSCHFVLRRLYESAYVSSLTTLYYEERVFLLFILLFIKTCSRKFAIVKPTNMRKIHSCCVQNLDTTDDKISQIPEVVLTNGIGHYLVDRIHAKPYNRISSLR